MQTWATKDLMWISSNLLWEERKADKRLLVWVHLIEALVQCLIIHFRHWLVARVLPLRQGFSRVQTQVSGIVYALQVSNWTCRPRRRRVGRTRLRGPGTWKNMVHLQWRVGEDGRCNNGRAQSRNWCLASIRELLCFPQSFPYSKLKMNQHWRLVYSQQC